MSAKFFQSEIPALNRNINCYDLTVRGGMSASNYIDAKTLNVEDLVLNGVGQITLPALTTYTQLTSETTPVTITGAEQQFIIKTAAAGTINPSTTRLFNVNHTGIVSGKTMVLLSRTSSIGGSPQLLCWVAYTDTGVFRLARHNLSTVAETGAEEIIVKLIQTV